MDKKLLGKRINTARKERGWTSERLSEACNINATYLLAEVLPSMEFSDMDVLWELWQTATPKQIAMMSSMIRSALEASKD